MGRFNQNGNLRQSRTRSAAESCRVRDHSYRRSPRYPQEGRQVPADQIEDEEMERWDLLPNPSRGLMRCLPNGLMPYLPDGLMPYPPDGLMPYSPDRLLPFPPDRPMSYPIDRPIPYPPYGPMPYPPSGDRESALHGGRPVHVDHERVQLGDRLEDMERARHIGLINEDRGRAWCGDSPRHEDRGRAWRGDSPRHEDRGRAWYGDSPRREDRGRAWHDDSPRREYRGRAWHDDRPRREDRGRAWHDDSPRREDRGRAWHDDRPRRDDRRRAWHDDSPRREDQGRAWHDDGPRLEDRGRAWHDDSQRRKDRGRAWHVDSPMREDRGRAWHDDSPRREDLGRAWHDDSPRREDRGRAWQDDRPRREDRGRAWHDDSPRREERGRAWHDDSPRREERGRAWHDDSPRREERGRAWHDDSPRREERGRAWHDDSPRREERGRAWHDDSPRREDRGIASKPEGKIPPLILRLVPKSKQAMYAVGRKSASSSQRHRSKSEGLEGKEKRRNLSNTGRYSSSVTSAPSKSKPPSGKGNRSLSDTDNALPSSSVAASKLRAPTSQSSSSVAASGSLALASQSSSSVSSKPSRSAATQQSSSVSCDSLSELVSKPEGKIPPLILEFVNKSKQAMYAVGRKSASSSQRHRSKSEGLEGKEKRRNLSNTGRSSSSVTSAPSKSKPPSGKGNRSLSDTDNALPSSSVAASKSRAPTSQSSSSVAASGSLALASQSSSSVSSKPSRSVATQQSSSVSCDSLSELVSKPEGKIPPLILEFVNKSKQAMYAVGRKSASSSQRHRSKSEGLEGKEKRRNLSNTGRSSSSVTSAPSKSKPPSGKGNRSLSDTDNALPSSSVAASKSRAPTSQSSSSVAASGSLALASQSSSSVSSKPSRSAATQQSSSVSCDSLSELVSKPEGKIPPLILEFVNKSKQAMYAVGRKSASSSQRHRSKSEGLEGKEKRRNLSNTGRSSSSVSSAPSKSKPPSGKGNRSLSDTDSALPSSSVAANVSLVLTSQSSSSVAASESLAPTSQSSSSVAASVSLALTSESSSSVAASGSLALASQSSSSVSSKPSRSAATQQSSSVSCDSLSELVSKPEGKIPPLILEFVNKSKPGMYAVKRKSASSSQRHRSKSEGLEGKEKRRNLSNTGRSSSSVSSAPSKSKPPSGKGNRSLSDTDSALPSSSVAANVSLVLTSQSSSSVAASESLAPTSQSSSSVAASVSLALTSESSSSVAASGSLALASQSSSSVSSKPSRSAATQQSSSVSCDSLSELVSKPEGKIPPLILEFVNKSKPGMYAVKRKSASSSQRHRSKSEGLEGKKKRRNVSNTGRSSSSVTSAPSKSKPPSGKGNRSLSDTDSALPSSSVAASKSLALASQSSSSVTSAPSKSKPPSGKGNRSLSDTDSAHPSSSVAASVSLALTSLSSSSVAASESLALTSQSLSSVAASESLAPTSWSSSSVAASESLALTSESSSSVAASESLAPTSQSSSSVAASESLALASQSSSSVAASESLALTSESSSSVAASESLALTSQSSSSVAASESLAPTSWSSSSVAASESLALTSESSSSVAVSESLALTSQSSSSVAASESLALASQSSSSVAASESLALTSQSSSSVAASESLALTSQSSSSVAASESLALTSQSSSSVAASESLALASQSSSSVAASESLADVKHQIKKESLALTSQSSSSVAACESLADVKHQIKKESLALTSQSSSSVAASESLALTSQSSSSVAASESLALTSQSSSSVAASESLALISQSSSSVAASESLALTSESSSSVAASESLALASQSSSSVAASESLALTSQSSSSVAASESLALTSQSSSSVAASESLALTSQSSSSVAAIESLALTSQSSSSVAASVSLALTSQSSSSVAASESLALTSQSSSSVAASVSLALTSESSSSVAASESLALTSQSSSSVAASESLALTSESSSSVAASKSLAPTSQSSSSVAASESLALTSQSSSSVSSKSSTSAATQQSSSVSWDSLSVGSLPSASDSTQQSLSVTLGSSSVSSKLSASITTQESSSVTASFGSSLVGTRLVTSVTTKSTPSVSFNSKPSTASSATLLSQSVSSESSSVGCKPSSSVTAESSLSSICGSSVSSKPPASTRTVSSSSVSCDSLSVSSRPSASVAVQPSHSVGCDASSGSANPASVGSCPIPSSSCGSSDVSRASISVTSQPLLPIDNSQPSPSGSCKSPVNASQQSSPTNSEHLSSDVSQSALCVSPDQSASTSSVSSDCPMPVSILSSLSVSCESLLPAKTASQQSTSSPDASTCSAASKPLPGNSTSVDSESMFLPPEHAACYEALRSSTTTPSFESASLVNLTAEAEDSCTQTPSSNSTAVVLDRMENADVCAHKSFCPDEVDSDDSQNDSQISHSCQQRETEDTELFAKNSELTEISEACALSKQLELCSVDDSYVNESVQLAKAPVTPPGLPPPMSNHESRMEELLYQKDSLDDSELMKQRLNALGHVTGLLGHERDINTQTTASTITSDSVHSSCAAELNAESQSSGLELDFITLELDDEDPNVFEQVPMERDSADQDEGLAEASNATTEESVKQGSQVVICTVASKTDTLGAYQQKLPEDSDKRRVPYTSGNRRHVYRNSPDPHRRRPGRNQQRSTTDTANFTRRQRTGGFGQHSGGFGQHSAGRGQHSVQQQWRPTRGQRPFGRGKLSFRGKRPFQGQQQTVQGQQFTPRGGWQGRGHRRRRWLPREQTRFMAHSDTTDLDLSNTGAHGVDRAGHGIDQASRSNLRVDRISRNSSRVNQVSRSSSQISQSSLPDIVSDKQGTTSTLEQLINEAVDSISDLDTPPGSVGSVDTSDSSADDPEASDSVQKRKKKKSKMRLTRSGKPSRWDVPPPPSPCSDQEETNTVATATQQAEGHHVQDRLLGLSGSLEKNDPQHAINQLTEKLRSLTSALPAPSEDALAALAPLPSPEIVASSSASITTSPKKVPRPVQVKKKKGRNQTPVKQKYQLTENLRSLTSALPVPSNDALASLALLPSPEIVASSSASITTSPKKVLSTKKPVHVKEKKVNKQNPVNVSHESLPARWQAVDLSAAHSSCQQFGGSGTAGNLWQPHILGKRIQQIHSKTSRRKPQAKMDEKPVGYDPDQILATVEPEPGKSVSTKRTVRLKAKPATSGKIPDKEKLKVKPQSGVPESEPRRLVKIKTPQTSIRAVHDQDTRGCEKSASRVEEKALNESVQTSPRKQNPNSSTYQGDPREMPRHSRQAERAEDEDALADSFAHASIQPARDFDFSEFFQHSRSEEQCFIDSLAQKCSQIKLDKSTLMNLNSEAGDAGRTQREEGALVGSTSWATSDHWHQGLEENASLADHQQVFAGLDPYQAANIPADAGLWNQGAHQTNPVTTNAVYNSGDAAAWQHGTTQTDSMTTNAAYIPGDAGVWNQGAHQTGPITQVSANIDPNQAAYIPGNAGVWNQGARQTGPVTQVSANIDPNQDAYIPGNAGEWNQGARQTHSVTSNAAYIPANQGVHQTSSVTQVPTSQDPYQAAYIPGNAGVWNQGARQTHSVTSNAAYIPANQGAHQTSSVTQVSTSHDPCQAAYIPGNAGVWQQDARQTDSVTSNVGQFSANKDTATCQGDGQNTGERRLTEVRTAQPFTEAKTTQAVSPTEVKTTQSVPLQQVKTTHPVPSGLGPSKITPRPEGTGMSAQARTRVPALKKARKGSVTNMNERDKLKALFSVRKKPPLTRMDSSETQPFKSPSKSIKGDPFSSAVQTSPVGKDVSMSCIFTVSKTTDGGSDAEKSFSQSVPNPKKALPEGKGDAKPMLHTVTSRQALSAPVPSVAYGMLDDMDQSADHEEYIDDDDILREIDSCLASPKSRIKNDTREKAEVQTRKDLASCRPMNLSHPSDDTVTACVDVAADGTRKTNTPKAAVTSTASPGTEVLETTKHSTIRSKDFTVKSPESSSVDDPLQSTIVVEQDPSGTTEINISVAITADDDSGKYQVRAGGAASLHVEGTSSRPATGELKDTEADDSEYVTTCFDLRLPRQQSLEIHLKPMLQTGDDLGDNIEVEVSTEAGSVTHTASNLLAETHVSRSVVCSERTISVVVDNNGDSERYSRLDEACVIKEMDVEIADIPEQLSVERVSASNEHADTDITEENTMPDYPDACKSQGTLSDWEKEDKGSESREQNRTLQKTCSVGADELDETESSTVDGAQEGNLEDGSNKKVQILRQISQEEEARAQSQTKDAVGFPTGESSQGDSQENETVGVLPGTLNKELDNPAELQETLAEENSHDVRTALHSSRVQPSGVTDGSCMETEKGESNDVHADLHSSQEQPDGESFMDTDLEVSGLCGSAAGKPESGSPTSPPCLRQWDECVPGAAGVCASPPHLEPQASLSTPTSPSVSPTSLSQPAVLDLNGNSVPEHKQRSGGCACGRSSSARSCVCNQTKQTLLVVEACLPNVSRHQALSPDRLSCVFGERDARAQCGESVGGGGGGHMGVGLVSVMSKHPEVQQKSFSHVDLFSAPAAMPGTTTNTTPAETLELEDSFSENWSPVSDDSDDSLSDGPDFGSSVIRSTTPLSTVNTNVSPQGRRSLPAGKQTHTSDERPTFSLDSLLSDTKNDEAEEHEICVMQSELKRDLISSKGMGIAAEEEDDDTEEADDENFTDEQRDQLLRLQQEEGQIREIHPGEAVLSDHPCGHLFTNNLLPTDCGVVTSATGNPLSQLLTNYQPEMLMDILSSDIISLAYGTLPCKEQVQRWLLFLLSCHSNATVVQKCGDQLLQVLQWQMEDIIEGNDKHTWAPRILDILRILVNWGANKDELVFDTAAADATQLGEVVPLHDNGGLPPVGQRNVESVLKVLSCLLQARPPYSTEELNQLLVMVCKVSLDQSLLRECLLSDLQVCMASILDCYEASKWHTAVPWLCRVLGGLSSHHHNQVYVTQLFSPTSLRGGYIQQRLAFFCLHNAVNHCSPTDQQLRDFQIQDLCELISRLRPLLQSDNYQLSSLIHLLDVSVGPAVQHITQRKQLCRLLESVRLIVSEIRDSVLQLDYTKVKGMLLHLCLKWDLSVKASNTKQRKIFNCLMSRPVLVEKLEDRGQMCNEEEGTDDLGFPLSDDQHSDEGESEGGGGKRLKTDGELTHIDRDKNLKEPRHGCEGATTSENLSSS